MKENLGPAHQPQNVQARRRHYDKSFIGSTIIGKRFNRRSKQESGNIAKCPAHHKGESALQFSARAHKTAVFFIAINFCAMLRPPFFSILITEATPPCTIPKDPVRRLRHSHCRRAPSALSKRKRFDTRRKAPPPPAPHIYASNRHRVH